MQFYLWQQTYLEIYVKPRVKTHTYIIYRDLFTNHISPYFNTQEIESITTNDINIFIYNLISNGNIRTNKGLSRTSANLVLTLLKSTFKCALDNDIILKNPASKVKYLKESHQDVKVLSNKDQKKLETYCLDRIDDPRYLGIIICLYTGLRLGELLALTWKDINYKHHILEVNHTKIRMKINNTYKDYYEEPKSSTSKRIIPLPQTLYSLLIEKKKERKSTYIINYNNKSVALRSYQSFFSSVLKKNKIERVKFHVLRHTFATRCVELGIDIKTLSEIMGHKNALITLNRYSHSLLETKRKSLNNLCKSLKTNNI